MFYFDIIIFCDNILFMKKKLGYKNGIIDGLPICFAYLAVSFTFGLTVTNDGFSWLFATIISGTNLTSAGQFAGIEMIAAGAAVLEVFIAVFIINSRYILMSLTLSQYLPEKTGIAKRAMMSFFVTDEIFAVANYRQDKLSFKYFMGLATTPYLGWTIGTLLGGLINSLLPPSLQTAMGIALYCMFIAIIFPPAKKSLPITFCILIATALSCAFYFIPFLNQISMGIRVIISSVVSAILTAIIFPRKDDDKSEKIEEVKKC